MKYWLSEEYVSFGPGAHSFFDGERYSYEKSLHSYTDAISRGELPKRLTEDKAEMSQKDREDEYVMLRMRLCDGASASEFYSLFGKSIVNSYPEIERFIKTGHIEFKDGTYRFTKEGFFVSNYILSSILFE
jgi:oxygen-independent coproporphyrinogen-3 oxidase